MTAKYTPDEIQSTLVQCAGGDHLYKHFLGMRYTDGVRIMAKYCEAYWLLDAIASHQMSAKIRKEPFQVWTLHLASKDAPQQNNSTAAILICTDGDKGGGAIELARQNIEYTDFPLEKITVWVEDGIMLLPSEH